MRVTHVVTFVSRDGAFGGPVAVAAAQAAGLARAGHDVQVLAGTDGTRLDIDGVSFVGPRTFRLGRGFRGLIVPGLWWRVAADSRRRFFQLHFGRDAVGLASGLILAALGGRYVVQTHGMVQPDPRKSVRMIDTLITKPVLRRARHWLTLDAKEEAGLAALVEARPGQVMRVFNAVAPAGLPAAPSAVAPAGLPAAPPSRATETADAGRHVEADGFAPLVVFLARLHPRKGAIHFAHAAAAMLARGTQARFEVWGPDEGDLAAVTQVIDAVDDPRLRYCGPVAPGESAGVFSVADVFVLPSTGEVFPMTVLEAMAAQVAVVAPADCDMAVSLANKGAVVLTGQNPLDIERALEPLLASAQVRQLLTTRAAGVLAAEWSVEALTVTLEEAYA